MPTAQNISRRAVLRGAGATGALLLATGIAACKPASSDDSASSADQARLDDKNWDAVLAAAKGTEVSWYGYGGDDVRNQWLQDVLVPRLKERYDITLNIVGMDINDILTQLSGEIQAGADKSAIDFIWINGENFFSSKQNGYLWGPFTDYLPNFNSYIDANSAEVQYDFGAPTDGFEAPYGKAQMVFWVDGAQVSNPPKNPDEFLDFCKAHSGQVTYPEPGDFTGTAFISCLIAGVVGKAEFEKLSQLSDPTKDQVAEIVQPGMDYLRKLNPYLWNKGTTFPQAHTTLSQMYADGELVFDMGYGDPQAQVDAGQLPTTTKSFVFETGTVGNSNFMAISQNAPHKAAALVAINEVISPEMQLSIYKTQGNISVLDMAKLEPDVKAQFDQVPRGSAQLPLDNLLKVRVTEAAGPVIPLLEEIWHDQVPAK